jgi:hypothetical protein
VPVASGSPLERDSGIPLVLLGVALMLAAVPSYGLTSLREAAVGANATTAVGGDVPDLRKV